LSNRQARTSVRSRFPQGRPGPTPSFGRCAWPGNSCLGGKPYRDRVPGPEVRIKFVMTREELLERITVAPRICFGKPCIRGHRIWVSLILDFLASGSTIDELLDQYPGLTGDDIRACIAWGTELAREGFIEIPFPKAS
jgi:uncharacterized protein (DUF433 family)